MRALCKASIGRAAREGGPADLGRRGRARVPPRLKASRPKSGRDGHRGRDTRGSELFDRGQASGTFADGGVDHELLDAELRVQCIERPDHIGAGAVQHLHLALFDVVCAAARLPDEILGLTQGADIDGLAVPDPHAVALLGLGLSCGVFGVCLLYTSDAADE